MHLNEFIRKDDQFSSLDNCSNPERLLTNFRRVNSMILYLKVSDLVHC